MGHDVFHHGVYEYHHDPRTLECGGHDDIRTPHDERRHAP